MKLATLKISVDFDGTMWSHMQFFRGLMWAMQGAGHQVGCLTGHSAESRESDIALMKSRGFPAPDFWYGRTAEYVPLNGAVYKSMVIIREGIDMHFDDCDYRNPETLHLFEQHLGDKFYRLVIVQHREPTSVHYE